MALLCWDDEGNVHNSQSKSNLIFGSSEASSLMTRYERAWPHWFVKEAKFESRLGKATTPKTRKFDFGEWFETGNTGTVIPTVICKMEDRDENLRVILV